MNWLRFGAVAVLSGAACCAPASAQPGASAPAKAPAQPAGEIHTADDLLRALERADQGIETLRARIRYVRSGSDLEGGGKEVRQGTLHFRAWPAGAAADERPGAKPRRAFAVTFDEVFIDDQKRNEPQTYIFDGEWLVEKHHNDKQMIKRRVVPPGQVADPLRIGEGPFPIPIGQRRADIVGRFDVELLPAGAGWPEGRTPAGIAGTYQLRLVPKRGMDEARDFREIRLWYRQEDLLPRMARTVNTEGKTTEVLLINVATSTFGGAGEGVAPAEVFDTSTPSDASGWDVDVREYRESADNGE